MNDASLGSLAATEGQPACRRGGTGTTVTHVSRSNLSPKSPNGVCERVLRAMNRCLVEPARGAFPIVGPLGSPSHTPRDIADAGRPPPGPSNRTLPTADGSAQRVTSPSAMRTVAAMRVTSSFVSSAWSGRLKTVAAASSADGHAPSGSRPA